MIRPFAVAIVLSFASTSLWAQAQTVPGTAATRPETPAVKPGAKKPAPKAKGAATPAVSTDGGACDLGVITAAGSPLVWKKVGITIFGNEQSEFPSDAWGIDDLAFSRVRAAVSPTIKVKRLAYARDAFESYNNPEKRLIKDARENFTDIVRRVAANSHCARYLVVVRSAGALPGTNQSLTGVGVYTHGPFGRAAVFGNIRVVVFDGNDFSIRKDPLANVGAAIANALSKAVSDDTIRNVAGVEFPGSPEEAAKNAKLRDGARELVAARLDKILPEYLKE